MTLSRARTQLDEFIAYSNDVKLLPRGGSPHGHGSEKRLLMAQEAQQSELDVGNVGGEVEAADVEDVDYAIDHGGGSNEDSQDRFDRFGGCSYRSHATTSPSWVYCSAN